MSNSKKLKTNDVPLDNSIDPTPPSSQEVSLDDLDSGINYLDEFSIKDAKDLELKISDEKLDQDFKFPLLEEKKESNQELDQLFSEPKGNEPSLPIVSDTPHPANQTHFENFSDVKNFAEDIGLKSDITVNKTSQNENPQKSESIKTPHSSFIITLQSQVQNKTIQAFKGIVSAQISVDEKIFMDDVFKFDDDPDILKELSEYDKSIQLLNTYLEKKAKLLGATAIINVRYDRLIFEYNRRKVMMLFVTGEAVSIS